MRILYIALDNPATENIVSGMHDNNLAGLPALYYPFKMLLERGHTLDLLLFSYQAERPLIESEHFKKDNYYPVQLPNDNGIIGKYRFIRVIASVTAERLKKEKYDFVYGIAEGAIIGVIVARMRGIPCAYRQFGVYNDFEKGVRAKKTVPGKRIEAFLHHTYAYIPMRAKMDFLLNTNDGSHQDLLFDIMKIKKHFKYFFWRSGIHIPTEQPKVVREVGKNYPEVYDPCALVQISRYSREKRQIRSVRILGHLHHRGHRMHLYFVGNAFDEAAQKTLLDEAKKLGVQDYIHFEGRQPQDRAWLYSRHALACLIPNESGLGNVFYENMAQGSMVVASGTSTLDEYIENGKNGFQFASEKEAADEIEQMLKNESAYWALRKNAFETARAKFLSIEKRFGMEADLIEDAANRNPLDTYPEYL